MARNLIENAIRHNVDSGMVRITTMSSGAAATLEIENDGPRIDPSLVDRLFEPFRRLERTANPGHGAGLGLAIVRSVVAAQGGRLTARARPDGGLAIAVELPRPTRDGAAMVYTTRGALEPRLPRRSE
jgi:signal transduction histidine kinase